jgi:hypothetical protein
MRTRSYGAPAAAADRGRAGGHIGGRPLAGGAVDKRARGPFMRSALSCAQTTDAITTDQQNNFDNVLVAVSLVEMVPLRRADPAVRACVCVCVAWAVTGLPRRLRGWWRTGRASSRTTAKCGSTRCSPQATWCVLALAAVGSGCKSRVCKRRLVFSHRRARACTSAGTTRATAPSSCRCSPCCRLCAARSHGARVVLLCRRLCARFVCSACWRTSTSSSASSG